MKLLSIDTSTNHFSLAVSSDEKILVEKNIVLSKVLESSIIPAIDAALKKAKIPLNKLDGFVVGLGPGSFTSLRVGVSTIKSFCLATGKPVVGIPSLDVIAEAVKTKANHICVVNDAKRNLVYACLYKKEGSGLKRDSEYSLVSIDDFLKQVHEDTLFVGDASSLYKDKILNGSSKKFKVSFAEELLGYPHARHLSALGLKRFKGKKLDDALKILPMYLYPEDCQVQR